MKGRSSNHLQSNGRNPSRVHKGLCLLSHAEQVVLCFWESSACRYVALAEVILHHQSSVLHFTPAPDSCGHCFAVHSPLLALLYLRLLALFLSNSVFCVSPSLSPFFFFSLCLLHTSSVNPKLTSSATSTSCLHPTHVSQGLFVPYVPICCVLWF